MPPKNEIKWAESHIVVPPKTPADFAFEVPGLGIFNIPLYLSGPRILRNLQNLSCIYCDPTRIPATFVVYRKDMTWIVSACEVHRELFIVPSLSMHPRIELNTGTGIVTDANKCTCPIQVLMVRGCRGNCVT